MATPVTHFDTGHSDTVHDSQFDYYCQRLATCSSDGIVRIFAVGQEVQYLADLTGHSGPVWQVTWGHPKFGNILASASFDHTVIVWKEHQDGRAGTSYTAQMSTCTQVRTCAIRCSEQCAVCGCCPWAQACSFVTLHSNAAGFLWQLLRRVHE